PVQPWAPSGIFPRLGSETREVSMARRWIGSLAVASVVAAPAVLAVAQDGTSPAKTPEALAAEIGGLRAAKPAWREIVWESRLCRAIGRSKVAPQGICVVNPSGKVLAWTLMFDDEKSVTGFLDRALERFRDHPSATPAFAAERYMRFPGQKIEPVEDEGVS